MHAWGLRLRRVRRTLAMTHPPMLPSAMRNDVGTPVAIISQLNTRPACAPVNASMAASRPATHDSGSGWFARPFLYDSFIRYSTPVYPGALRSLLVLLRLPENGMSIAVDGCIAHDLASVVHGPGRRALACGPKVRENPTAPNKRM